MSQQIKIGDDVGELSTHKQANGVASSAIDFSPRIIKKDELYILKPVTPVTGLQALQEEEWP